MRPVPPPVRRLPVLAALVVAGCLPRALRAQAPDDGGVIAVQTFDKRGDLQASVVYGITRDRDGLLWIATDEGAAVFNGHDWRAVPMPSSTVNQARSILAQRDGTMWFGTRDGVVRVHGRDTTVFTSAPDGLAPGSVYQLLEVGIFGGRQVLASSFRGMGRFDGTRWHRIDFPADFPADGVVAAETRDARGALELWIASPNVGMRRWQAGRWERIGPEQGLFLSNIEWLVVPETPRPDGTRLFAVGVDGVAALRGTRWSVVAGAPRNAFRAIDVARRDGSRELWVGTTDRGLWRQTAGGQWRPVRAPAIDAGAAIIALEAIPRPDGDPIVYAGFRRERLTRFALTTARTFPLPPDLADRRITMVRSIQGRDGMEYWFGTSEPGLVRVKGDRAERDRAAAASGVGRVRTITRIGDTLWIAGDAGTAYSIDGTRWIPANGGLDTVTIRRFGRVDAVRPVGLYGATSRGLVRWDAGRWQPIAVRGLGSRDGISDLTQTIRPGDSLPFLWVAVDGGEILRVRDEIVETTVPRDGPLGQVTVNDLYLQHLPGGVQRLWAATAGLGGLRVADPDADRVTWRTAPLEVVRALPTDFVRDVTGDALGRIFAATPRGIVQLRSVTPDSVVLETIYGVDEGLPSEDVYKIELTPDGELIVGTAEGVGRIRPESVALADNTALYLVARHVAGGDSVLTSGVRLPHDAAAVRFDMALLNYHREEQTRYRTELVGGAGGVSDWDAQPRTAFGALAPGSYRFRVWARDYRGQVHGPREFAFSVAPAPWASPAAYLAYVVFGTLGLALLIRWRTQAARRRAEELLVRERLALQNERKFRALFDRAFDAHLLVEQGTITTANPAGAALLAGGEAERLVGEPLARFLPDVEELPLGAPREGVTTRLDGSSVPTEVLLAEISTDEESARRLLHVTLRDLTVVREAAASRARLEERVRESQKLEALGTLAGGIAHDFNNLLTVIRGNAELARQATTPDPAHLEQILDVTGRARDLVRQILTFSRRSPAVMEPLDLAQVVAGLETLLRSSLPSSIELAITVPSEPVVVIGDATQLQQMVLNLTTNAEYAMRARGGTLALTVERIAVSTDGRTGHAALAPGRYARLEVRDTGLGMNAETLARVFEPFFTTKPVGEGTGLGLAVLHGIVASHRGSVSVESEPGWGTAFEILMPLAAVAPAREAPMPAAVADSVAPRVLLLDDDADVLAVTGRLLTRLGHRVESFGDPVSAVRWFREHAREVDVIVSDQTMPLLSGDRVIEAMRAIRPDVPAIIVTGFSHFLTPERVAALGQLEVLDKPVDARDLAAAIRAAHRRATEGASA